MHASGIKVDDEVKAAFNSASNDPSSLYIKFQIQGEAFRVASASRGKKQNTLKENFLEISKALAETPNDPAFLVAKHVSSEAGKWLLIFYMPEGCTVRDRMVYAASSAALKEGLGLGNFDAATFSVGKLSECTAEDYEAVSRSMSHDDLLTLDEKDRLASENESAKSMSSTKTRAIVGLPIKASEESLELLAQVQKGSPNTIILQLNADTEVLQVQQAGNFTFEQVQTKLPLNEPRYVLQNFSHEHDGSQANAYVFVYYCPDNIKPKLKMFYSTCKQVVVKICENLGITLTKSIELSEVKELSTSSILEELYPQASVKKTFKKPTRPGRGNARLITNDGASSSSSPPAVFSPSQ